ncbi:MAG: hypothetical protein ACI9O4_000157 [Chitinophagales bacterium]|jgi:hypothetical protein
MSLRPIIKTQFLLITLWCAFQTMHAQTISIDEILALNLEEDKGPFATLNDELVLIQGAKNVLKDSLM